MASVVEYNEPTGVVVDPQEKPVPNVNVRLVALVQIENEQYGSGLDLCPALRQTSPVTFHLDQRRMLHGKVVDRKAAPLAGVLNVKEQSPNVSIEAGQESVKIEVSSN